MKLFVIDLLRLFALTFILVLTSAAQTTAPGGPGQDAQWLSAGKQAIGTSANLESKVWFTLANGVLTEVLYPNIQTANVQMLQFVVVNPKTKKVETEWDDTVSKLISEDDYYGGKQLTQSQVNGLRRAGIRLPALKSEGTGETLLPQNSLNFIQQNTAKSGKWKIKKRFLTDPENNTVIMRVLFDSTDKNLQLYVYFDPSLRNSGMNDTAWANRDALIGQDGDIATALVIGEGRNGERLSDISAGFFGVSDGLDQLRNQGNLGTRYEKAGVGNVTQIARIESGEKGFANFTLALAFGRSPDESVSVANRSIKKGFDAIYENYVRGWNEYLKAIPSVDRKYQSQFNMAAMVMKALEDKTARGGNVASLSVPWGGGGNANEGGNGYRMVWSRDLYHVFTAFLAIGDRAAAERALDFLFKIQQKEDGSFPQNSDLTGKMGWGSLQMDEVGYPLIMAWQLSKFDKDTYEKHVKRAADFIVKDGPFSPQERWEERPGYSPSTIAAEIAGLVCAADIAKRNGDNASAELYLKTADNWVANIEKWTVTTKGKYGDGNYYIRISEKGEPDGNHKIELNNNAGTFYEHEIVDAGFLEFVRLGIKPADDPLIVKSLKVIDQLIKVETPNGPAFYRYNNDGYGEMPDGRKWNWDGKYTGKGRPWPLLSGERGQYELAQHNEYIRDINTPRMCPDGRPCRPVKPSILFLKLAQQRLDHMLAFASESLMLPEQIWDKKEAPPNTDRRFIPELKFGEGTGSATPLAWSMAQFIRLATNLKAGKNLDTPQIVYDRYVRKIK